LAGICLLGFFLNACVTTTTGSHFSKNADKKRAVEQYTQLGLGYIQQGKTSEAMRPLKRALEIDPQSPDVHNALAFLFQREKQPDLADKHFKTALQYSPDNTKIHNNYAAFLFEQNRFEEACKMLNRATSDSMYEFRARLYENLGLCYLQLNDKDAALAAFERAVAIDDTQSRALLEAAIIHFERKNYDASADFHKQYQRLVRYKMAPNMPQNLWLGVQLARITGNKNEEASYKMMLNNMFPDSNESKL
jgi:type IV pilus assembly protein PilF